MVFAVAVLLSLSLCLIGDTFTGAEQDVGFNIDSYSYTRATIYGPRIAFPPYKYRVVVPYVAHQLMYWLEPYESLKVVGFVSYFFFYLLVYIMAYRVSGSYLGSAVGLIAIFFTYVHQHWAYRMIAMIDGTVLLVLCVMVFALMERKYIPFLLAAVVGSITHEFVIFLTPAWFITREWRRSVVVVLLPLLVFWATKQAVGYTPDAYWHLGDKWTAFYRYGLPRLENPWKWFKDASLVWGVIPVLATIGLLRSKRYALIVCGVLILSGALLSMMFAETHDRLLYYLSPVMAVGIAGLIRSGK